MRRFLVGLVIASIAAATPIGALAGDKEIAQHILQKIDAEKKAGKLRGFDVNLRVEEGHVWLTGQVASNQQMQLLMQIASRTSHLGTKQVHRQLQVAKVDRPVAENAKKTSRFPNFLAVFNREEKKEEASEPQIRRLPAPNNVAPARQESTQQFVSSRRTSQPAPTAQNNFQGSNLEKQRTSHEVSNQTASLPPQAARPSHEFSVAKAAPANRTTPLPVARRTVEVADSDTSYQQAPTPQTNPQTTGLEKQRTWHEVDNQIASLPPRAARPSREVSVTKAAAANRTTPLPVARRSVAFAGGEIQSLSVSKGEVQQVANNQEEIRPIQVALTPDAPAHAGRVAPAPIPLNDVNAVSKLSPEQLAALYQQWQFAEMQRMQQAQAEYARQVSMNQTPVAFAPAGPAPDGMGSTPMAAPSYMPVSQGPGIHHDHPNMPAYAWPGYAAHPNYAAVTYPKQYAPSAWPYIGPFYPYPQVPLGWRKVQLEWDDGWWFLNFKNRHFR